MYLSFATCKTSLVNKVSEHWRGSARWVTITLFFLASGTARTMLAAPSGAGFVTWHEWWRSDGNGHRSLLWLNKRYCTWRPTGSDRVLSCSTSFEFNGGTGRWWFCTSARRDPLAHNGHCFDEMPEFESCKVLDSLREPLESGEITSLGWQAKLAFLRASTNRSIEPSARLVTMRVIKHALTRRLYCATSIGYQVRCLIGLMYVSRDPTSPKGTLAEGGDRGETNSKSWSKGLNRLSSSHVV